MMESDELDMFGWICYNSKPLELDLWGNLILGNIRELNKELFTK